MGQLVAIVSNPRAGSTLLHDLIAGHTEIIGGGELCHPSLFRDVPYEDRGTLKVDAIKGKMKNSDNFVFKYFYQHADEKIDEFLTEEKAKVIFLYRSPLDMFISEKLVEENSLQWEGRYEIEHLTIDPRELERFLLRTIAYQKEAMNKFSGLDLMKVHYRYLCDQPKLQMERVFAFLGVNFQMTKASTKKQRTKNNKETISNMEELLYYFLDQFHGKYFAS